MIYKITFNLDRKKDLTIEGLHISNGAQIDLSANTKNKKVTLGFEIRGINLTEKAYLKINLDYKQLPKLSEAIGDPTILRGLLQKIGLKDN